MESTLDLQKYKKTLEKQRRRLLQQKSPVADESLRSNNPDRSDLAVRYEENQRAVLLEARVDQQLQVVEEALLRIKNKTYGQCKHCGQEINPERLAILPATAYCVHCIEEHQGVVT